MTDKFPDYQQPSLSPSATKLTYWWARRNYDNTQR
jgi:hypothetical protein